MEWRLVNIKTKKMTEDEIAETIVRLEELLDISDPITKSNWMEWYAGDNDEVSLCEILLEQLIRNHKEKNGEYYNTDYDQIKLRYQN